MSEDIDFKIVSRNQDSTDKNLPELRLPKDSLGATLQAEDFSIENEVWKNPRKYFMLDLGYQSFFD